MPAKAKYDLLLKGGELLDPGQRRSGRNDIAFAGGKVAAVGPGLRGGDAAQVIDISNRLVTPGLIDLHAHLYFGGFPIAVKPDEACLPAGVTTALDAGSSGGANFGAFHEYIIRPARTRLRALLHIGALGLAPLVVTGGELLDKRYIDVDRTADALKNNRGTVLGVKIRMHMNAMPREDDRDNLRKAREAADKGGGRLMVHVSGTPIPLPEILELLRPGDIVTHLYNGYERGVLDATGKVLSEVRRAAERGVVLDVGHAGVHLSIPVAQKAIQQGLLPTTISTDLHHNAQRHIYTMPELIAKFVAFGMPLEEAVAASTCRAAVAMGLQQEIGGLSVGMAGDAAVFDMVESAVTFVDATGNSLAGKHQLRPVLTVKDGQVAWRAEGGK